MGFDNQYEKGKSSRLLIVQVYEDAQYANIVCEFKVGAYTPEYGDNDRMPTGNLLTCYWVEDFDVEQWSDSGDADEQFDARVQEIVRSTKLPAWRASVQGPLCTEGTCKESFDTWKMYSVERFFEAPIIWDVRCRDKTVSFMTVNNFKQNNADWGAYKLYEGKGKNEKMVGTGGFHFDAHWRPTKVHAELSCGSTKECKSGTIEVSNKWGRTGSS